MKQSNSSNIKNWMGLIHSGCLSICNTLSIHAESNCASHILSTSRSGLRCSTRALVFRYQAKEGYLLIPLSHADIAAFVIVVSGVSPICGSASKTSRPFCQCPSRLNLLTSFVRPVITAKYKYHQTASSTSLNSYCQHIMTATHLAA